MFPKYYNLVLGLRPFTGEVSDVALSLINQGVQYPATQRQLTENRRKFIQWVVGELIFEQFLCEVRNHRRNSQYEEVFQQLKKQIPNIENTFSQCVRSVVRMHQLADSFDLYYDGLDAFLLRGQDHDWPRSPTIITLNQNESATKDPLLRQRLGSGD